MEACLEQLSVVLSKLEDLIQESLVELFAIEMLPMYQRLLKKEDLDRGECTACYVQTVGESLWYNVDRTKLQTVWGVILQVTPNVTRSLNWLGMKADAWEYTQTLQFQMRVIRYVVDKLQAQEEEEEEEESVLVN